MKKFFATFIIVSSLLIASAVPVYAQVTLDPTLRPENLPTISGDAESKDAAKKNYNEAGVRYALVTKIGSIILGIAGVIAIYFIMDNAFNLIISAGNEETVTSHKKGLMWAVIGLLLLMLSYSIMRFIISLPFDTQQAADPKGAVSTPTAAPATK